MSNLLEIGGSLLIHKVGCIPGLINHLTKSYVDNVAHTEDNGGYNEHNLPLLSIVLLTRKFRQLIHLLYGGISNYTHIILDDDSHKKGR